jgi:uncharacterized membrane protein (DUF485 family)
MSLKNFFSSNEYVKVDDKNRFYFMLQQMQSNRWRITVIVLFLFFFINCIKSSKEATMRARMTSNSIFLLYKQKNSIAITI